MSKYRLCKGTPERAGNSSGSFSLLCTADSHDYSLGQLAAVIGVKDRHILQGGMGSHLSGAENSCVTLVQVQGNPLIGRKAAPLDQLGHPRAPMSPTLIRRNDQEYGLGGGVQEIP